MGAIGFDIPALISIGERQGIETDLLLLILPFADAGLSHALAEQRNRHQQDLNTQTHG